MRLSRVPFSRSGASCLIRSSADCTTNTQESEFSAHTGIIRRAPLADWTSEAWDEVLAANLKACFFLAQRAAAPMRNQRHGRIIFITSIAGILGRSTVHAYVASKSGLAGLTRSQ